MNISGVVVRARPANITDVKNQLSRLPGVEVHAVGDNGNLVITIEAEEDMTALAGLLAVQQTKGVLSASLVYHEIIEESETQEALQ